MPQTSQKIRRKIKLELQNYSICQISRITNIHKATVSRVILRFKERGSLEHQKNPGGPKKITEKVERIVVRYSKKTPFEIQPSCKKSQTSILQSQQFGKYLSNMASDHEFVPRSQKLVNQIA